jgi:hypothetical protein
VAYNVLPLYSIQRSVYYPKCSSNRATHVHFGSSTFLTSRFTRSEITRNVTSSQLLTRNECCSLIVILDRRARSVCDLLCLWFKSNGSSFSQKVSYDRMAHVYFGTSTLAKIPSCTFPSVDFTRSGQSWADHAYVTSMIYGS